MAKLYYDAQGQLLAFAHTDDEDAARWPGGFPGAAGSLSFDETTNQTVLDSLDGKAAGFVWQDHTVSGGNLFRKGSQIAIAADAPDRQIYNARPQLAAAARALWNGTANPTQRDRALAALILLALKKGAV